MSDETKDPLPRARKTAKPKAGAKGEGKPRRAKVGAPASPDAPPEVIADKLGMETMPDGRKVQRRIVKMKETHRCPLTPDEHIAKARELSRAHEDIRAEVNRQAEVKTELKAKMGRLEAVRDELSTIVGTGNEWRTVVVEEIYSYATRSVTKVRTDTGETINVRAMTDQEMQMALPLKGDAKPGDGKDPDDKGDQKKGRLTAKVSEFPNVVKPGDPPADDAPRPAEDSGKKSGKDKSAGKD